MDLVRLDIVPLGLAGSSVEYCDFDSFILSRLIKFCLFYNYYTKINDNYKVSFNYTNYLGINFFYITHNRFHLVSYNSFYLIRQPLYQ